VILTGASQGGYLTGKAVSSVETADKKLNDPKQALPDRKENYIG
jgi:hypothetical protein